MSFCFHSLLALASCPLEPIAVEKRQNLISAITVAVDVFNRRRHSMLSLDEITKASVQRFLISKKIFVRHVKITISRTISEGRNDLDLPNVDMSPASDPKPLSDMETTAAPPHAQLVQGTFATKVKFPSAFFYPVQLAPPAEPHGSDGELTPRVKTFVTSDLDNSGTKGMRLMM